VADKGSLYATSLPNLRRNSKKTAILGALIDLFIKHLDMKDKIGFNLIFAILAFPIGLALLKDTNFDSFTFKKPVLDLFYLITLIALIYFMLKKPKDKKDK
jgi:hypothetical protein